MEQCAEAIERGKKKVCGGEIVRWDTCCVNDGKEVVLKGTESRWKRGRRSFQVRGSAGDIPNMNWLEKSRGVSE